jgi:alpha-L-rhamnosidase
VKRARLYITSLGVFQAYINGAPVGDHFLAPGWTSYHHRLNYEVFDIAPLLREGENVIAVEVAEGWYATRLGFHGGRRFIYGDEMALIAQLEIESESSKETILSDSSWKSHTSALISSEIYDGEVYDAREEEEGDWTTTPFQDETWPTVRETAFPKTNLVAPNAPPVRVTQIINPVQIITTPSGQTIVDFGQNLVGRVCIPSLLTPPDTRITLTHAEVLENNELSIRPLRDAKCTDTIISAGQELKEWKPRFTFHGFRYVQISNWTPSLSNLHAEVLHTDLKRSGTFKTSHEMVNKLHENATWSMRGNFLSIPTDCPQRDERLGWTGDIQIFAPSASFLYNTAGMLGDWLEDLAAEQISSGTGIPPFVVPNVIPESSWPVFPQAVWDDVTVLLPWTLYESYGDVEILRRQYASMLAWVNAGVKRGPDRLWDDELFQLGDWLDPTAPPEQPGNSRTDGTFVADAYLVHVTKVLGRVSRVLGEGENASRYESDYLALKARFQEKYVTAEGYLVGDTQTAFALVIFFDLLDSPAQIARAGARLARLVRRAKFQVSTGFAGTPIITHALCKAGYVQLAYRMLLEKTCPSWMFPITMGATTIWERWDSMRADGSVNPGEMTSFNHYALGSIVNWLHKDVAGVSLLEPGWKRVLVKPLPGGTVTSAEVRYETAFGELECRWALDRNLFQLSLAVPPNSSADVVLPGSDVVERVGSGSYRFETKFDSGVGWPPKSLVPPMFEPEDTFV